MSFYLHYIYLCNILFFFFSDFFFFIFYCPSFIEGVLGELFSRPFLFPKYLLICPCESLLFYFFILKKPTYKLENISENWLLVRLQLFLLLLYTCFPCFFTSIKNPHRSSFSFFTFFLFFLSPNSSQ